MSNSIHIPGFPPPQKQDSVKFYVLKSLSYAARIRLYLVLVALGFLVQLLMMAVFPGAILLLGATALNLVVGYDSRVRLKNFDADSSWTEVDMERIAEVQRLDDRITKWNMDALDISNAQGVISFLLAAAGVIASAVVITQLTGSSAAGLILAVDAVILVLPMWFNGIKQILKQDNLRVKIGIVRQMAEYFQLIRQEGETFKPALMLARNKTGKSVPTDTRFTVAFDGMPADFYGIQAQINLNVVQGASYPYFYCVIPAKKGFGLESYVNEIPQRKQVTVEFQQDQNAEVIVIRQTTTKTSGYHTKPAACKSILETALLCARMILAVKEGIEK